MPPLVCVFKGIFRNDTQVIPCICILRQPRSINWEFGGKKSGLHCSPGWDHCFSNTVRVAVMSPRASRGIPAYIRVLPS